MSATQQPQGSIPAAKLDDGHESDEWHAALARVRRDTYEGPDSPPVAEHGNVVQGFGHAVRVHEQAASPPKKSSVGAMVVSALVVGAAATVALLWMHQDHRRLMAAKDQQVQRLESQKLQAQEGRAQAENTLANERSAFAAQLQAMRLERNAALNAASDASGKGTSVRPDAASVKASAVVSLPKFPGKKEVSNDPLGGLADLPKRADKKRK